MTHTIAFFNNKGGVGKTTLVYNLAHMFAELGRRVLLLDLDPQSNLTSTCLEEDVLDEVWPDTSEQPRTLLGSLRPLIRGIGDVTPPHTEEVADGVLLIPGSLGLAAFEDKLSNNWPAALSGDEAAFRLLSGFYRSTRLALEAGGPFDLVLMDLGPNLGAINRTALLGADFLITPMAPDRYSIQGLRNLGPTLARWRQDWQDRRARNPDPELVLPSGQTRPLGYLVMQAGVRLSRPVAAYDRWVRRIPSEYAEHLLGRPAPADLTWEQDEFCLGVMRHFHSLMPLAQEARKPLFLLRPADGAIGTHMKAVGRCRDEFQALAQRILARIADEEASGPT